MALTREWGSPSPRLGSCLGTQMVLNDNMKGASRIICPYNSACQLAWGQVSTGRLWCLLPLGHLAFFGSFFFEPCISS